MADTEDNRGLFPDAISSGQLRAIAKQLGPKLPLSDVVPELKFRDTDIDSGGIADLQFAICQLIEKASTGVDITQLLSACVFLFHHCYSILDEGIDEAKDSLSGDDRVDVLGELTAFKLAFASTLDRLNELHQSTSVAITVQRLQKLRSVLGNQSTQSDYASHLLISEALLESLGMTRDEVKPFIESNLES